VGSLLLHAAIGSADANIDLNDLGALVAQQLWSRKISMKAFIEAVLPGTNPGLVQAALYAQGLRYRSARERCAGLIPLSEPDRILRYLAREQRHGLYMQAMQARLQAANAANRQLRRKQERLLKLAVFHRTHAGFPRLFSHPEVDELNQTRPRDDQLERLPSGLLKHHCCYPHCPHYLQNLRTVKDRRAQTAATGVSRGKANAGPSDRRHGLFKHLAPMMYVEASGDEQYIPLVHSVGAQAVAQVRTAEVFAKNVRQQLRTQTEKRPSHNATDEKWLLDALPGIYDDMRRIGL